MIFEPDVETLPPEHVRALRARAERQLHESIGCTLPVTLIAPGTSPRSEGGKLQRVLDKRATT